MVQIKQIMPEHQQVMTLQTGKRGFTLVELMVVIGVIIVIAASILTILPGMHENAQEKATQTFMERLEIAIERYYDDNRSYPLQEQNPRRLKI